MKIITITFVAGLLFSHDSHAQLLPPTVLDELHQQHIQASASWQQNWLKAHLENRINDNFELLSAYDCPQMYADGEPEANFMVALNQLWQEQQGLIYIADNLSLFARQENLEFDNLLERNRWLYREYQHNTEDNFTPQRAKLLLNRFLYFGLQRKYKEL